MKKTIDLGKVDYNGTGRRINRVTIEVEIKVDGELSMVGNVWNAHETDALSCGQNSATISMLFPHNAKVERMVEVWERWHLNHMRSGSPAQEAYLRDHPVTYSRSATHYEAACDALATAGLHPDADGYRYGSAWLREDLPATIVAEVESW